MLPAVLEKYGKVGLGGEGVLFVHVGQVQLEPRIVTSPRSDSYLQIDGHGNDRQTQIVLMFTKKTDTTRRFGDSGCSAHSLILSVDVGHKS